MRYANSCSGDFGVNYDVAGRFSDYAYGANIGGPPSPNRTRGTSLYEGPKACLPIGHSIGFV